MPTCRSWISTAPSTSGPTTASVRTMKPRTTTIGVNTPVAATNINPVVITRLRCGCVRARVVAVRRHNAFYRGDHGDFAQRNPRGSPFQMPTRLADGLGPESDLNDG